MSTQGGFIGSREDSGRPWELEEFGGGVGRADTSPFGGNAGPRDRRRRRISIAGGNFRVSLSSRGGDFELLALSPIAELPTSEFWDVQHPGENLDMRIWEPQEGTEASTHSRATAWGLRASGREWVRNAFD